MKQLALRVLVFLWLFSILFVAVPLSRAESERRINPKPRPQSPPFENTVYAPVVKLKGYPSATLVLNNRSSKQQMAYITFFDQQGNATPEQQLVLPAGAVTYRTIEDLLPLDLFHRQELGGVSVRYVGHWNEVATQLILLSDLKTGSFEYRLLPATVFRSKRQNAVWWMPSDAEAGLAVGNSGTSVASVSVTMPDGKQIDIRLKGHETRVITTKSKETGISSGYVASARVEVEGDVGAVQATGYIRFPNGVSRTIRFYDPEATRQPSLFASNLQLQNRDVQLVLKNIGDGSLTATPRFYPVSDSPIAPIDLAPVELSAGEQTSVDFSKVISESAGGTRFNAVSVRIESNGAKGSLIGALATLDQTTGQSFEIPLRDSGPLMNAGGSYPWRFDGGYETDVSITNITDEPAKYMAVLRFENGEYTTGPQTLHAGQTTKLDIRRWRDEDIPDINGRRIPHSVSKGQIYWSMIDGGSATRLIGRSQITNQLAGISSSFSCPVCCPADGPYYDFNPSSVTVLVDGLQQFGKNEGQWDSCYGHYYSWPTDITLVPGNSSIAYSSSVQFGMSETRGVAPGLTADTYTFDQYVYENDTMDCYQRYYPNTQASQPETVLRLSCTPSPVTRGSSVSCSTNAPSGTAFSSWKFTDTNSHVVTRSTGTTNSTWSGVLVTNGTVQVTVTPSGGTAKALSASVSVQPRNWTTQTAIATQVPNGTFYALPVPPHSTGNEGGVGESNEEVSYSSFSGVVALTDNGPNHGFGYYSSQTIFFDNIPIRNKSRSGKLKFNILRFSMRQLQRKRESTGLHFRA